MSVWNRNNSVNRLVRQINFSNPLVSENNPDTMAQDEAPRTLMDRMFPDRVSRPSCITLPPHTGNHFEIHPSHISILPKFGNFENNDPYTFVTKFEQVCETMKLQQLSDDGVRLRLIPFALTDYAERWFLSLPSDSIKTWDEFKKIFLRKFYPLDKTTKIRNEIVNFHQFGGESFAKYFERFKELLISCPHHNVEKWDLCQIVYNGLNNESRILLESMCQGDFLAQDHNAAWQTFENLAEKFGQWERPNEKSIYARSSVQSVGSSLDLEAKIDALSQKIDNMSGTNQFNQASQAMCYKCNDPNHIADDCPHSLEQINAFNRARNDPFSQTYNPGWRNHPNFSWKQNAPTTNANRPYVQPFSTNVSKQNFAPPLSNQSQQSFAPQDDKRLTDIEKTLARLETQLSQLTTSMSERERLIS